jgi:hypothetical protein
VVLGLIVGGIFGESLGFLFDSLGEMVGMGKDNPVSSFFTKGIDIGVGMDNGGALIDLYMLKFRLGIGIKLNFLSFIGMLVSLYIMKWSGER